MKKNSVKLSRAKRMMMLGVMSALTKNYESVNEACVFALEKEKRGVSKLDVKISRSLTLNFFDAVPGLNVAGTDATVLNFCRKSCDLLIAKTAGNDKIRGLTIVSKNIKEQLETIDESQQDDSQLLMNELR